jgi:hypothetical protein
MSLDLLRSATREIVDRLAERDYESAIKRCVKSRLTHDDLHTVIHDYGRTVVSPPTDAYNKLDAVEVEGAAVPTWSISAPLWTAEEGRSDLTLELTISLGTGAPKIELDDLLVP